MTRPTLTNKSAGSFSSDTSNEDVSDTLLDLATKGWTTDPLFTPFYHDTGYIISAHTPAGLSQLTTREGITPSSTDFEWLSTPADFRATMPDGVLTGDFPGWKGGFKRKGAGWVFARGALVACFEEARRLGVKFITGLEGDVTSLLSSPSGNEILGVETTSGEKYHAETTILAAGATAPQLLDMKDQLRPTAWTLAHIKMSAEECKLYKDLPVLFNIENGFFMEPDEEHGELKICDEHPGYTSFQPGTHTSIPFPKHQIPLASEARVRSFLCDTMPQLADRPFSFARICWCADTPDRNFLIDRHPEKKGLALAVGGSGHGFMHITSVSGYVADVLEGRLDERLKRAFRWRPETAVGRNWRDVLSRRGGPNRVMDFGEVGEGEWADIPAR